MQPTKTINPSPTIEPTPSTNYNGVIISNVDKIAEIVTIQNTTSFDVDLENCSLVSVNGNQKYTFPKYILTAGKSITASGNATGNFIWD